MAAFKKHVTGTGNREAMCGMHSRDYGLDVGELLSTQHKNEKAVNRAMFRRVLQNMRFLAYQVLALEDSGQVPMPSTNATSERSFSSMRRLKTYLRSTMEQPRLNHVMLWHMHKEILDPLDLDIIGNKFVSGSEHRLRIFGNFKTE